jgi:hypothetical protein
MGSRGEARQAGDRFTNIPFGMCCNGEQMLKKARIKMGVSIHWGVASGERSVIPHVALLAAGDVAGSNKEKCNARAAENRRF